MISMGIIAFSQGIKQNRYDKYAVSLSRNRNRTANESTACNNSLWISEALI